jgi:serine/threonine protein kinase
MNTRREVESLPDSSDIDDEFFEQPVFEAGMGLMGKTSKRWLTGKTVGSYVIGKKLGSGGMGEVYLAEDARLSRRVALKFLSHDFAQSARIRAQIQSLIVAAFSALR